MGPVWRKAGTIITYTIILLIFITQLQYVKASPLPKTTVPPLEGPSNYKNWSNLMKNSLIILGIWYAVNNSKPDKKHEKIINKPATKTENEVYHWGTTILNHAELSKWIEDNTKATVYISLFARPTAEHHIDDVHTSQDNWKTLKEKYGTQGAMATFHSLQALQQFKFDPNTSFAMQIENLQLV
jgi:hypothetical protein